MLSKFANFRQKVVIWNLVVKLVLLTGLGLFLPMQALGVENLEIRNIEIDLSSNHAEITWYTNLDASTRLDYGQNTDYGSYLNDTSADSRYHSATLNNLEGDQTYHFKISATSVSGQTVSTFDMIFETDDYNDGIAPKFENFHERYITGQTATLQWESDEKASAKIYYGTSEDYNKNKSISGKKTAFEITLKSLDFNTIYYYKIELKDEDGNIRVRTGDFQTLVDNELDTKILEISRVKPVTNNDEAISYTAATVSWHANKLADGAVRYGTNPNRLNKKVNTNSLFQDFDQTAHLSGLKSNTLYYFQVEVKDVFGKTAKSNIFSFQTKYLAENIQQASVTTKLKDLRKLFTAATNLYKEASSGKIYAIVNNQKHLIFNSNFFERYGYSFKKVQTVSSGVLNNIASIRLVKDPTTDKIYYLAKKGNDRWLKIDLPTPSVFSSYSANQWNQVVTIDKEELDNYPDVNLVKAQGAKTVYLLDSGIKRPIASAQVFEDNNFKWSDILEISQSHLDAYFTGSALR
ncbi:fibronectin type III domain-containing protein [Candidatus Nomurabacteria bacterium]|nr:fibronectin type III domain-containing protein [Candidatus Nomurabacteria bacterium]